MPPVDLLAILLASSPEDALLRARELVEGHGGLLCRIFKRRSHESQENALVAFHGAIDADGVHRLETCDGRHSGIMDHETAMEIGVARASRSKCGNASKDASR